MVDHTVTSPPAPRHLNPRGALRLVVDRDFGSLFWGKLIGVVGVWAYAVAAAIAVYDATGSTLAVGLVAAAQFLPQLALAPLSGTWADRRDPKRQLIAGRLLCLAGAGGLAAWVQFAAPQGWALAIAVFTGSLAVGIGFVVGGPAMQSVVPRLVTREELPRAMSLNTAPMTVARVTGPILGAGFVAITGPALGFAFAAAGQLIFLALIGLVRIPEIERPGANSDYSVRAAWRHMRSDWALLILLLAAAATAFGAEPSITLAPALADEFGAGAGLVGALAATFGAGSAVGMLMMNIWGRPERSTGVITAGLACLTVGMGTAALSPWVAGALTGFAIAGSGFTLAVTSVSTTLLLRVPDYLRGRVMAFWMIAFVGVRPLAAAAVGMVSDSFSVRWAILVAVLVTGVAAVVVARVRPADLEQP